MKFEEILSALKEGKKITRPRYNNIYLYIHHYKKDDVYELLYGYIKEPDEICPLNRVMLLAEDLMADDWSIVDEKLVSEKSVPTKEFEKGLDDLVKRHKLAIKKLARK